MAKIQGSSPESNEALVKVSGQGQFYLQREVGPMGLKGTVSNWKPFWEEGDWGVIPPCPQADMDTVRPMRCHAGKVSIGSFIGLRYLQVAEVEVEPRVKMWKKKCVHLGNRLYGAKWPSSCSLDYALWDCILHPINNPLINQHEIKGCCRSKQLFFKFPPHPWAFCSDWRTWPLILQKTYTLRLASSSVSFVKGQMAALRSRARRCSCQAKECTGVSALWVWPQLLPPHCPLLVLRPSSSLCPSPDCTGSPEWKVKVLVAQTCLTLRDPVGCSPPGSSVHGILQERILEWVNHSLLQRIFLTQRSNLGLPIAGRFFTIWATRAAQGALRELREHSGSQSIPLIQDALHYHPVPAQISPAWNHSLCSPLNI